MTNPPFIGKLNPDVKAKWLAALRSGDYPQTTDRLHDNAGFCCLGVLCEVALREGVLTPDQVEKDTIDGVVTYHGSRAVPPAVVTAWAYESCPEEGQEWGVLAGTRIDCLLDSIEFLPTLNDNGAPFADIADRIESSL